MPNPRSSGAPTAGDQVLIWCPAVLERKVVEKAFYALWDTKNGVNSPALFFTPLAESTCRRVTSADFSGFVLGARPAAYAFKSGGLLESGLP